VTTIYLIEAIRLAPPVINGMISESFYPMLCALIMYPLCLKLLYQGIKAAKQRMAEAQPPKNEMSTKPLILAVITGLFILLFAFLGFLLTAPFYVFFFMLFFDDKPQQFLRKLIYAIAITAGVYILYEVIFEIHFPEIWR
jgi:putative tricarboxylic transport membrane protein